MYVTFQSTAVKLLVISAFGLMLVTPAFAESKRGGKKGKAAEQKMEELEAAPPAVQMPSTEEPEKKIEAVATDNVPTESPSANRYGKKDGMLGQFAVGPYVTAAAFPTPFRFGVESKYSDFVGLSAEYGIFPTLTFSSVSVGMKAWQLAAKVYPFQGAFFIGLGFGKQTFTGEKTEVISSVSTTVTASISTTTLTPHIGWKWIGDSGVFFGMEFGAQLASSSTVALTSNNAAASATAQFKQLEADVRDKGKTFGETTLPAFTLLQIGYLF